MDEIKLYYSADDIAQMLGVSKSSAYIIIRRLNEDLEKSGYITIRGKISRVYFSEKWYGSQSKVEGAI